MILTFGRRTAVVLAIAWIAIVTGADVRANCQTNTNYYLSGTIKSRTSSPVVSTEFTGVWWLMGYGDPAFGTGIDNGSYPSGSPGHFGDSGACFYGQGCWLRIQPTYSILYYGVAMEGRWLDSRVDGCVDDATAPACMAALFSDQGSASYGGYGPPTGQSFLGVMTALEVSNPGRNFFFNGMTLAPMTAPPVANVTDSGGVLRVQMGAISPPAAAIVTPPGSCRTGLVEGFRLYQQVVPPGGTPSKDRKPLSSAGWTIARGGAGPGGAPAPDGSAPRVEPIGCVEGGKVYLATRFAFESGFEAAHLSPNTAPISCGTCSAVDADGDGARADKCATPAGVDCDDGRADLFPGAPQVCDGVNNDCSDPLWPALDHTNEVDEDGDGLSGCAGDPCPRDADNDADGDAVCGDVDNCRSTFNSDQADLDGDGAGDVCDVCPASAADDRDLDGLCGNVDNCPLAFNPGQVDADGDGLGDPCDACPVDPENNADGDQWCGNVDPCPHDAANDADRDGQCGDVDPCPLDAANDAEHDGVCADVDVCPLDPDPGQEDVDGDGFGDACDLFAPPRSAAEYPTVSQVAGIAAADFDGDGDLDLASSVSSIVEWQENVAGNGSEWRRHTVTTTAVPWLSSSRLAAADLTGDGQPDILYSGGDGIVMYENHNKGANWTRRTVGSVGHCFSEIAVGDLDQDGDADVEVASSNCQSSLWWAENSSSNGTAWTVHVLKPDNGESSVTIADFDGDGDADLASGGIGPDGFGCVLTIHLNTLGNASSWSRVENVADQQLYGRFMSSLSPADVDGDGDLDLVGSTSHRVSGTESSLVWYQNLTGDGLAWERHVIDTIPLGFQQSTAADVDGDGDADALTLTNHAELRWYENRAGDGSIWLKRQITGKSESDGRMEAADVDGDGAVDVSRGYYYGVEWHENVRSTPGLVRAVAGPDFTVECAGAAGAQVTLDGSGSSPHPDGLPLLYTWSGPFPTVVSTEPLATVTVPPGTHDITLTVSDAAGRTDSDVLRAAVVEPAGAQPRLVLSPSLLWPPNHRMVKVNASLEGTCAVGAVLMSVHSNEPDDEPGGGDGATTSDVDDVQGGSLDLSFLLRAERRASGEGRVYNVMFGLPDASGSLRPFGASVVVPRSVQGVTEPIDLWAEQTTEGTIIRWTHTGAPSAFNVIRARLPQVESAGNLTNLDAVVCIRSGSTAMDTIGFEDAADPPAGEAFLYLVESDDGASRSAYSTERAPRPYALSGDCPAGRMGRTGTR